MMFESLKQISVSLCVLYTVSPWCVAADAVDVDSAYPDRLLLHVCSNDGTPIRPLVSDSGLRHRLDRQGSPAVSKDGKRVVFDAWTANDGFTWEESRIVVVDLAGTNAQDISDGNMPSFSPDGNQLVVSRPPKYAQKDGATGMSIWIMDSDGNHKRMLADQGAWGGRWSPDGQSIVFRGGLDDKGESVPTSCLRLFDVETGKITNVFSPDDSPFADLSYHFAWSKGEGRMVVFGGPLKAGNGSASATIEVDKGMDSLVVLKPAFDGPKVMDGLSYDWNPDGKSILMTGTIGGMPFPVLLPLANTKSDVAFEGIPKGVAVRDPVYTPDGQNIIASFGPDQWGR